jgi:hypothetical protein
MTTDQAPELLSLVQSLQDLVDAGGHVETVCRYLREWAESRYARLAPAQTLPQEDIDRLLEYATSGRFHGDAPLDSKQTPAAAHVVDALDADHVAGPVAPLEPMQCEHCETILDSRGDHPGVAHVSDGMRASVANVRACLEILSGRLEATEDLLAVEKARAKEPLHDEAALRGHPAKRRPKFCEHCGAQLDCDWNHPGGGGDENIVACRDFLAGRVDALEEMLDIEKAREKGWKRASDETLRAAWRKNAELERELKAAKEYAAVAHQNGLDTYQAERTTMIEEAARVRSELASVFDGYVADLRTKLAEREKELAKARELLDQQDAKCNRLGAAAREDTIAKAREALCKLAEDVFRGMGGGK